MVDRYYAPTTPKPSGLAHAGLPAFTLKTCAHKANTKYLCRVGYQRSYHRVRCCSTRSETVTVKMALAMKDKLSALKVRISTRYTSIRVYSQSDKTHLEPGAVLYIDSGRLSSSVLYLFGWVDLITLYTYRV